MSLALVPRWAWYALGALAVLLLAAWALDSYGDRRFAEGRAAEEKAWRAAEAKLLKKAAEAGAKADKAAAARTVEHAAAVADEREKIAAKEAEGGSPFDVMFGGHND